MATAPTTAEKGGARGSKGPSDGPSRQGARNRRFRVPAPRLLLSALGLAAVAVGVLWALYGSDWFRVERVKTSGTRVLTAAQVEKAAAVPAGAPLASVDTDAIAARTRQLLPRIESIEVVRSWPHGIDLRVTERQPALLIEKGGKFTEVDRSGVRFATVATAPGASPCWSSTPPPPRASAASARTGCSGRRSASGANSRRRSPGTPGPSASPRTTPSRSN